MFRLFGTQPPRLGLGGPVSILGSCAGSLPKSQCMSMVYRPVSPVSSMASYFSQDSQLYSDIAVRSRHEMHALQSELSQLRRSVQLPLSEPAQPPPLLPYVPFAARHRVHTVHHQSTSRLSSSFAAPSPSAPGAIGSVNPLWEERSCVRIASPDDASSKTAVHQEPDHAAFLALEQQLAAVLLRQDAMAATLSEMRVCAIKGRSVQCKSVALHWHIARS